MSTLQLVDFCSMIRFSKCFHLPNTKTANSGKTLENGYGKCLKIAECKILSNVLKKPINIVKKHSACGFENEVPKICCPQVILQVTENV
jgi:hypothetical protein